MAQVKALQAAAVAADDPKILAADIEAQVAKAKSEGRTISLARAAAELRAETHGGEAEKIARQLTAQVAKAKSEGRRIGLAQAHAELETQGVI
jgi:chitinase